MDRLAEPHRDALSAAFGLAEGPVPEPFLIALAAGSLVVSANTATGRSAAADDVQWLDPQTHLALAFTARRTLQERDPVLIIGAARTGHTGPLLDAGFPTLDVAGVSERAASQILLVHAPEL